MFHQSIKVLLIVVSVEQLIYLLITRCCVLSGFSIMKPTEDTKGGELVILEFKRMSFVTDQYVKRAKHVAETQYVSLKSALQKRLDSKDGP